MLINELRFSAPGVKNIDSPGVSFSDTEIVTAFTYSVLYYGSLHVADAILRQCLWAGPVSRRAAQAREVKLELGDALIGDDRDGACRGGEQCRDH